LSKEERVNELATLLSGSEVTNEALEHAKGLLFKIK
jgi:DNA repair ATPase RecN